MTLRDSGKLKVFACDGKGCSVQWGTRFHPAEIGTHARLLSNDGWRVVKIGTTFRHFCPSCEPEGGFEKYRGWRGKKARKGAATAPAPAPRYRADLDG